MALTQFEKDCIDEIYTSLIPKDGQRASDEQQADLDTIKHGNEVERQPLVTTYINDVGLAKVATDITICDDEIAATSARKTDLQTKQTTMQAYVA